MELPSYNLSAFINIANSDETRALLHKIKNEPPDSVKLNGTVGVAESGRRSVTPQPGPSGISAVNTEENSTEPSYHTINPDEIMAESTPEVIVTVKDTYSRFRYVSEKAKERKRQRHNDDEQDKCLAEVQLKNYVGTAKVIAHCVDSEGNFHPFFLFGNCCNHGVYLRRFKFKQGRPHRLNGVSVIMPTSKDIKKFVHEKKCYLNECGIKDEWKKEDQEKQVVYLKFIIQLEETDQTLMAMSSALHNRKQGKEFQIDCVQPPSAPAKGPSPGNLKSNMVLVVVSKDTNFPAEPGIILREHNQEGEVVWENTTAQNLEVIKKAVVKFYPPQYHHPDTSENVVVELSLCDMKTKVETEPVQFVYYGSDEYGVEIKGKKRKLDNDDVNRYRLPEQDESFRRQANVAMKKKKTTEGAESKYVELEDYNPAESAPLSGMNSDDHLVQQQIPSESSSMVDLLQGSGSNNTSSITASAGTEKASSSLPFLSYLNQQTGSASESEFKSFNHTYQSESQERPPSSGFVTSASTMPFTPQISTYQTATVTSNYMAAAADDTKTSPPQLQQQQNNVEALNLANIMSGLEPNQHLAFINGQIYIINDDTAESQSNVQTVQETSQSVQFTSGQQMQTVTPTQTINSPPQTEVTNQNQASTSETPSLTSLSSTNIRQLLQNFTQQEMLGILMQQAGLQPQQQIQFIQQPGIMQTAQVANQFAGQPQAGALEAQGTEHESETFESLNDDDDIEVDGVVNDSKARKNETQKTHFDRPQTRNGRKLNVLAQKKDSSRNRNGGDETNSSFKGTSFRLPTVIETEPLSKGREQPRRIARKSSRMQSSDS